MTQCESHLRQFIENNEPETKIKKQKTKETAKQKNKVKIGVLLTTTTSTSVAACFCNITQIDVFDGTIFVRLPGRRGRPSRDRR